jgi:hypothetical protein
MKPWMIDPKHPKFWKPSFMRKQVYDEYSRRGEDVMSASLSSPVVRLTREYPGGPICLLDKNDNSVGIFYGGYKPNCEFQTQAS